ncbi:MAG TPA: DUF1800 domain-containing protein [Cyclobacteriaceae bacterium]|jgi:uncharacterized protein (DUF1800 family)|nr:DUF1800 domain-containing protein [Cyclobacteriaceae bacterium]
MNSRIQRAFITGVATVGIILLSSFLNSPQITNKSFHFPYKDAGLTEAQAAAHLLDRFTYGHLPGQVEEVVKMGLETWFQQQLNAKQNDDELNQLLNGYDALTLSNTEIVNTYLKGGQIKRMAVKDGIIDKDSLNVNGDKQAYRKQIADYLQQKGLKAEQELIRQFVNQKILRAAHTNNQLQEVMTEFWFNHFNVSFTKNDCSQFIPNYERDVIRPNSLGNFSDLLLATAKSPAMLMYLDNFSSTGTNAGMTKAGKAPNANAKRMKGLNENYAREVMELHSLGVDGGYTQADVTEAARVLTGWTVNPMNDQNPMKAMMSNVDERKLEQRGIMRDGDFLFAANRHDDGDKTVLGKHFAAGGEYEEGVELLDILAHHKSTANFISKKLAVRFVNDNPPQSLIDKMAKAFLDKKGDIKQVLITMVSAPEFWSPEAIREKTKSPFELAISSVRTLNADIKQPYQIFNWVTRMGQKIYYYQAPTGFPDKGQYWINTGSLLNRMNFGLALATSRIPGVSFDLLALNNNQEPESAVAALNTYSKLMLAERNVDETINRLTPLLNDPNLQKKVNQAADNTTIIKQSEMKGQSRNMEEMDLTQVKPLNKDSLSRAIKKGNDYALSQVIGIIIGSPEFQRR